MIKDKISKIVKETIDELWGAKIASSEILIEVERPQNEFGDYAVSVAFALSKMLGASPNEVASLLAEKLNSKKLPEIVKIEVAGGYINFFLAEDFLKEELARIYKNRESYGKSKTGGGKKIIIDYCAPNIAKPMHVGHLRSTIIGDALANVYKTLGYKVVRWNYLGDWGTQFGKLIAAYKLWGDKSEVEKDPIKTLEGLYVKFHEELKESDSRRTELEKVGQEEFQKLEEGDKENRKLWEWFKEESLKEFEKMYDLLGVEFDTQIGESDYEKDLAPTIADLKNKGVAEIGEGGSVIVKLDRFDLPPALIQKSDGASLYITRDIALLKDRIKKYKPEKILYVVANQQTLHFQQLFAIAEMLGLNSAKLEHIKFGLVLGGDKKKLSTREGNAVTLEEVVNKAVKLARDVVEKKSAERQTLLSEEEKEEIAQVVAIGALKYQDLKEHRNSDIVFDWQRMLDFTGDSGPYLQYTYARLMSILRKSPTWKLNFQVGGWGLKLSKPGFDNLGEKPELAIIKHFLDFPDVLEKVGGTNLPNHLALYLYKLANLANRFYETVPVIKDENTPRRAARLALVETAAAILKTGLGLLGIKVLEKI
ncbi:MAG: arginine--tRNA ligase [Patescibacteria group bacterium]